MNCPKCNTYVGESLAKFCYQCGAKLELAPQTSINQVQRNTPNAYCTKCGFKIGQADKFCTKCGEQVPQDAKVSQVSSFNRGAVIDNAISTTPFPKYAQSSKTKRTAVLLAVFFSYFSFLYTYKKNRWKFWICSGLNVIAVTNFSVKLVNFLTIYENLKNSLDSPSFLERVLIEDLLTGSNKLGSMRGEVLTAASEVVPALLTLVAVGFVMWLFAIIYNLVKDDNWYKSYQI